jgi:hypothetical protein
LSTDEHPIKKVRKYSLIDEKGSGETARKEIRLWKK